MLAIQNLQNFKKIICPVHYVDNLLFFFVDIATLDGELSKDYSHVSISQICVREDDGKTVTIICFKSIGKLKNCLKCFYDLSKTFLTTLFLEKWKTEVHNSFSKNPELTFDDVFSSVWMVCFDHFQCLLDELKTLEIKLCEVDKILYSCKDKLETELLNLYKGINGDPNVKHIPWIHVAVIKCMKYWDLCQNCNVAKVFLKLKNVLNLKGDFGVAKELSQKVTV